MEVDRDYVPTRYMIPATEYRDTDSIVYLPSLFAHWKATYFRQSADLNIERDMFALIDITEGGLENLCKSSRFESIPAMTSTPPIGARFEHTAFEPFTNWSKRAFENRLIDQIAMTDAVTIFSAPQLGVIGLPTENELDVRMRCAQQLRQNRDLKIRKLKDAYTEKLASLSAKQVTLEKESEQYTADYKAWERSMALYDGKSILGALINTRPTKKPVYNNLKERMVALLEKKVHLAEEFQKETNSIFEAHSLERLEVERIDILPDKQRVRILQIYRLWLPHAFRNGKAQRL